MSLPPTHCPVCNAMERFATKRKRIGEGLYVYTRCTTCRTEFPISYSTAADLRQKAKAERERRSSIRRRYRGGQRPKRP